MDHSENSKYCDRILWQKRKKEKKDTRNSIFPERVEASAKLATNKASSQISVSTWVTGRFLAKRAKRLIFFINIFLTTDTIYKEDALCSTSSAKQSEDTSDASHKSTNLLPPPHSTSQGRFNIGGGAKEVWCFNSCMHRPPHCFLFFIPLPREEGFVVCANTTRSFTSNDSIFTILLNPKWISGTIALFFFSHRFPIKSKN